MKNKVRKEL